MPISRNLFRNGERGQVAPIAAVGIAVLVLFASLTIDVGIWHDQQQHAQNAADSAALAGAAYMYHHSAYTNAQVVSAAENDASANNFSTTDPNVTITVTPGSPSSNDVEVYIRKKVNSLFNNSGDGIAGTTGAVVVGHAVAGAPPAPQEALITLDTGSQSFSSDEPDVEIPDGSIEVDGFLRINSNGQGVINSQLLGYTGGSQISGAVNYKGKATAATHESIVADPCKSITICNTNVYVSPPSSTQACAAFSNTQFNGGASVSISPGRYCTQLTPSGHLTLNGAGVYNFSGGLNANGNGYVTGKDAIIYCQSCTMDFVPGTKLLGDSALIDLGGQVTLNSASGTSDTICGIIYVPHNLLIVDTHSSFVGLTYLIANDLTLNTGATLHFDGPGLTPPNCTPGASSSGGTGIVE